MDLTIEQAKRFILLKQGLLGEHRYSNKEGVYKYIEDVNCIQFDPIDMCGKNHELVLQSRVKGFNKTMLYDLLYEDRALIDYYDKNMAILLTKDWPYFERNRKQIKPSFRSKEEVLEVIEEIYETVNQKGPVSSNDLDFDQKVDWSWSSTRLSRAVLETLYYQGKLIVHHKNNTKKYYDLAKKHIDKKYLEAKDPNQTLKEYYKWYVLRRIKGIGMAYDLSSDAWLGIKGLKAKQRKEAINALLEEKKLKECNVAGLKRNVYITAEDAKLLSKVKDIKLNDRIEFLAPLDNLLWDRNLIFDLFKFHYRWEVYTPVKKREYGYYVLPVLYNDNFIGRIEIASDKKKDRIEVKNYWWEDSVNNKEKLVLLINVRLKNFASFNQCSEIKVNSKKIIG